MQIGIPAETVVGENRVAATPETVKKLISAGHSVVIERRAGVKAAYIDSAYEQVGATLTDDAYTGSQMILKVRAHKLTCRVTSQCFLLRQSTSACSQC